MTTPGTTERLTALGPWPLGANNLALETSVPRRSFRHGVNVDVTDDGKLVRRSGYSHVIEAVEPGNLFGYGPRGFFVEGTRLFGFEVVDGRETAAIELYDGLQRDARVAYAMVAPDLFVSDGHVALRISPENRVSPWAVPAAPPPVLSAASTGGTLAAGRYHVAVAYKNMAGEEGPLSPWQAIELSQGQVLTLQLGPAPPGLRTAVYMTKPDGTELLHLVTVPHGTPAVNVARQHMGRPPVTEDTVEMPAGNFALMWNGRLVTARDRFCFWSEPMQYSVSRDMYNYLEFPENVTMLAANETTPGFFVGQVSRTFFVAGADPADASLVDAYPAGVVPGTLQMVPGARLPLEAPPSTLVPMWLATNGVFCVGLDDGTVFPLTESRYVAKQASEGAALFDQRAGINRFITTLRNPSENSFAVSDQFTAEVVRNGLSTRTST